MRKYNKESEEEMTSAAALVEGSDVEEVTAIEPNEDKAEPEEDEPVTDMGSELEEKKAFTRSQGSSWNERLKLWLPFLAVVLLGAVLRFWGLGDKPLHHDESLHAYFSLQLLNNLQNYHYDPLLHGPFQFHFIALVYKLSQWLGAADNGVNTTTVRILAATLGSLMVGLPYFLRGQMGRLGAWLACFLLAVSPSMVYFSRFAREDIYMAFFTLLLVVAVARYLRTHYLRWLLIAFLAYAFSYATKEATFLTVAVFGSFMGGLVAWEFGLGRRLPADARTKGGMARFLPETAAPLALVIYACVAGILGLVLLKVMKNLSIYITTHTKASDAFVANLKADTLSALPILLFVIGAGVLVLLVLEMRRKTSIDDEPRGFLARIDPERQPLLFSLLTTPWMYWFFAAFAGCTVFLVLFTVVFTNAPAGIADGIWQGLYYWLQQQQVARGGQPWYYYLLLIPLYEQVGLVFGLAGIVYSLFRPTRFRLFLSYWALGNLFIYSWAAEKMPWLMIHIMLPLLLLAAVILSPLLKRTWALILDLRDRSRSVPATEGEATGVQPRWSSRERVRTGAAVFGVIAAVLLLLPTVHNMYEVSYVHAADGPHEMMVYVQTTTDVNTVMGKVDLLDQKLFGGTHQLKIGLTDDATWPFAWYLRDYPNTCFKFPEGCPAMAKDVQVIITGGDSLPQSELAYTTSVNGAVPYSFHTYKLRTWWDEGYKTGNGNAVAGSVGPLLWLSYGDNPPKGASFNPALAAQNVWNWWWERRAIGGTDGAYEMGLFIRKGLGVSP